MSHRQTLSHLLIASALVLLVSPHARSQCEIRHIQSLVDGLGQPGESFGSGLAADGDWSAIGTFSSELGRYSAAVHLFERVQGAWQFSVELHAPDGEADDYFGSAVAMSGEVLVIGAYGDDDKRGSAYVYRRSGRAWSYEQKLSASDGATGDELGRAVATDGQRIVATALRHQRPDFEQGAGYVWVHDGGSWTLEQKLVPALSTILFGDSAAIDGDRILIGAPQDVALGYFTGAVFAFERSGSSWSQTQRIFEPGAAAGHHFGLRLSMRGGVAVISAHGSAIWGGAHVFRHDGARWSHEQRLIPVKGYFQGQFGSGVVTDGELVVVGDSDGDSRRGLVNTFRFDSGTWTQIIQARAQAAEDGDRLGYAVAIARNTVLGAAVGDEDWTGAVRTFAADERLHLEIDPAAPSAGERFQATIVTGAPGNRVLLAAVPPQSGPPFGLHVLAHGTFDAKWRFTTDWRAPVALTGVTIDLFGYGLGTCGGLSKTERISLTF